jgi:Flp pilus assembly pilin Flp
MLNKVNLARGVLWGHGRDEKGQALGEYAVLVGLIAIVVVAAAALVGTTILGLFNQVVAAF